MKKGQAISDLFPLLGIVLIFAIIVAELPKAIDQDLGIYKANRKAVHHVSTMPKVQKK